MLADLEDTSVADIFGVENTVKQIPFPETILLNPSSKEGADAQVKEAIQYIPSKIRVVHRTNARGGCPAVLS